MKAITYERYGSPEVLALADVEMPEVKGQEVLVRVRAVAVNPADYQTARGDVRFATGLWRPRPNSRIGYDLAGEVVAVGSATTRFKPGDAVFGAAILRPGLKSQAVWLSGSGSFAEFALAHEDSLVAKPAEMTFEQAASLATAGWVALQGLRAGKIRPGHHVLISSATGGIGTFAVQFAKAMGAHVTGVCSAKNRDLVLSLGADAVVDYAKEDYTQLGERYDAVFDTVGDHSLFALRRILNPAGVVIFVGVRNITPTNLRFIGRFLLAKLISRVITSGSRPNHSDLLYMKDLMQTGRMRPVIARTFDGLSAVSQAVRMVNEGHAWGKVVVTV